MNYQGFTQVFFQVPFDLNVVIHFGGQLQNTQEDPCDRQEVTDNFAMTLRTLIQGWFQM